MDVPNGSPLLAGGWTELPNSDCVVIVFVAETVINADDAAVGTDALTNTFVGVLLGNVFC